MISIVHGWAGSASTASSAGASRLSLIRRSSPAGGSCRESKIRISNASSVAARLLTIVAAPGCGVRLSRTSIVSRSSSSGQSSRSWVCRWISAAFSAKSQLYPGPKWNSPHSTSTAGPGPRVSTSVSVPLWRFATGATCPHSTSPCSRCGDPWGSRRISPARTSRVLPAITSRASPRRMTCQGTVPAASCGWSASQRPAKRQCRLTAHAGASIASSWLRLSITSPETTGQKIETMSGNGPAADALL